MREIEIIFFDAGRTLLYPEPDVGEVYAAAGRRYGLALEAADARASFAAAFDRKKLDSIPQDREWWRGVVREALAPFGEPTDPERMFDEIYGHFTRPSTWRLYPGARETLAALRHRGYRAGLISNWDDRLPGLLEGLGLLPLLDPVVVSYRVGAEKPDPLVFEVALAEAGVPAGRALMIGDDREADILGARRVGMEAVHLLRRGEPREDGASIRELPELLGLLA